MANEVEAKAGLPAAAESREVTTKAGTKSIIAVRPAEIEVYDDIATENTGLEHIDPKQRRIPILRPLDPKSPQCNPPENGGIPGATGGTIFNTVTSEIYDRKLGLYIIPFLTDRKFVNYIRREDDGSGGGFVGIYEPNDPLVKQRQEERQREFGNLFGKLANGVNEEGKDLELVETNYLYCIVVKPNPDGSYPGEYGEYFPAVIPFASTQIKQHGAFIDRASNFRYNVRTASGTIEPKAAAMWSHVWHLRPHLEKRGTQTWWGWRMSLAAKDENGKEKHFSESRLRRDNPLFIEAEKMRKQVLEGLAQVDYSKDTSDMPAGEASESYTQGSGQARANDEPEIPWEH